ncbi:hypothetical protein, partial [Klebsiella pneumoniae]|uniref:hypothetical protein n=1 Tax=Klebsiella pneumoniae TaxID=573 RepID=UPI003F88AC97
PKRQVLYNSKFRTVSTTKMVKVDNTFFIIFQAEEGIRDAGLSRELGDGYKRQHIHLALFLKINKMD